MGLFGFGRGGDGPALWRPLQVHAYIVSYLKKEMPSLFGREKKKEELLMRLPEIYTILQREHHISPGDFPNVSKMQVEQQTGSGVLKQAVISSFWLPAGHAATLRLQQVPVSEDEAH